MFELDRCADLFGEGVDLCRVFYVFGTEISLGKISADCNHDGMLTSDDVIILLRYLAGILTEL